MEERDSHLTSLLPPAALTRRGFVVTSLAAGFALAVQPVSAETIVTDSNGLTVGEVKIPVSDGEIPGYRAMPAEGGPFATVLVVQEVFGVHEHIKDICRRLAKAGYFAVAPALYARQADVSQLSNIDDILKVVAKVPEAEVASDLDATVAWAASTGKADTAKLGITGFCWGGRQVWLYAEHNPKVKAAVAWYGPLQRPANDMMPVNPIDPRKSPAVAEQVAKGARSPEAHQPSWREIHSRACRSSYGTGIEAVQRGISGSWQALVTTDVSSRVNRRSVTTPSESGQLGSGRDGITPK